jgi:hypothetical protein
MIDNDVPPAEFSVTESAMIAPAVTEPANIAVPSAAIEKVVALDLRPIIPVDPMATPLLKVPTRIVSLA